MLATVLRPITVARAHDLDPRQLGRRLVERVGRDGEPGRDDAARVLAARGDHVEGGRGAEVDDDRALRPALVGGHRVDDPVGADLARVLVQDRHAGLDAGADDQRLDVEVPAAELLEGRQRRAGPPTRWRPR